MTGKTYVIKNESPVVRLFPPGKVAVPGEILKKKAIFKSAIQPFDPSDPSISMSAYSNSEIIGALRSRDQRINSMIRKKCMKVLRRLMYEARIYNYPASDMYNDILRNIYMMVDKPGFQLYGDFYNYFIGIAEKHIQYFRFRKANTFSPEIAGPEETEALQEEPTQEEQVDMNRMITHFRRIMRGMHPACRRILRLFFLGYSNSEAANRMKRTETAIRTLKKKCKNRLMELLHQDPEFRASNILGSLWLKRKEVKQTGSLNN